MAAQAVQRHRPKGLAPSSVHRGMSSSRGHCIRTRTEITNNGVLVGSLRGQMVCRFLVVSEFIDVVRHHPDTRCAE